MELKQSFLGQRLLPAELLIVPYGIETEYQIVIILGQGLLILPFNLKLGN